MTINELILLAESSGLYDITDMRSREALGCLEYFASKVVAHERDECAKLCEIKAAAWLLWWNSRHNPIDQGLAFGAEQCADAIRRRGKQ